MRENITQSYDLRSRMSLLMPNQTLHILPIFRGFHESERQAFCQNQE